MKLSHTSLLAACVPAISARFIETHERAVADANTHVELYPNTDKFLVETSPGETKWVTEEDKWEMKRVRDPQAPVCYFAMLTWAV